MAFPVSARSTGTLITAAIWNADIKDNLNDVYSSGRVFVSATSIAFGGAVDAAFAFKLFGAFKVTGAVTLDSTLTVSGISTFSTVNVSGNVAVRASDRLVLDRDASNHTYLYEKSNDLFALVVGGTEVLTASDTTFSWKGFGTHSFSAGGAGANILNVRNPTAGTGNYGALWIGNDDTASLLYLHGYSSTFTTAGREVANGALIEASRAGGMSIAAINASGAIRFYTGGTTERWRMDSGGSFIGMAAANVIRTNTSDGSDSAYISINGGGSGDNTARGGYVSVYGNENGSEPGSVVAQVGNVANSRFVVGVPGINALVITGSDGSATFTSSNATDAWTFNATATDGAYIETQHSGTAILRLGNAEAMNASFGAVTDAALVAITGDLFLGASGDVKLRLTAAFGVISDVSMQVVRSFIVGSPTGGSGGLMGDGTINVEIDLYKNGAAYTNPDFVFEHYFTGRIERFAGNEGAAGYGGLMPLRDLRAHVAEHYRFPLIPDAPTGIFDRTDIALTLIEQTTLYLFDHEDRLDAHDVEIARLTRENTALLAEVKQFKEGRTH